jgi:hypothetical protein
VGGLVKGLILVALLAAGAVWYLTNARLPDPEHCDRAQLLLWLVGRDLEQEPFELRVRLLRRLEQDMPQDLNPERARRWLTEARRAQLERNIAALVEPWFFDKMERYFALPRRERTAYVDQVIDRLAALRGLKAAAEPQERGVRQPRVVQVFMTQVAEWQKRADPKQRAEIREFLFALQTRWVARGLFNAFNADRRTG